MNPPDMSRPGVWRSLFPPALSLMRYLEEQVEGIHWTFGGGTVLMLRIAHRLSKDIDLFVPDPQALGYVNPRLSDVAERVSTEYEESAEFIKLILDEGEIDVVAGPSLTQHPWELVQFEGRGIKVETCAEIIAKKMWHRGDRAKARDLFDLCAVADAEPEAIEIAAPFLDRHGEAFLSALSSRADIARFEFAAIDAIGEPRDFDQSFAQAREILSKLA